MAIDMDKREDGSLRAMVAYFGAPEREIIPLMNDEWDYDEIAPDTANLYDCHLFYPVDSTHHIPMHDTANGMMTVMSQRVEHLIRLSAVTDDDVIRLLCSLTLRFDIDGRRDMMQDFCIQCCILLPFKMDDEVEMTMYYRGGRPVSMRCDGLYAMYIEGDMIHIGVAGWGTATLPTSSFFGLESNS